jgi:hypothetical protein
MHHHPGRIVARDEDAVATLTCSLERDFQSGSRYFGSVTSLRAKRSRL